MKAVEQFPEVASIALGLAKEHREGIQAGIDANERSAKDATASIDAVIDGRIELPHQTGRNDGVEL